MEECERCEAVDADGAISAGGCDDRLGGVRDRLPGSGVGGRCERCEEFKGLEWWLFLCCLLWLWELWC